MYVLAWKPPPIVLTIKKPSQNISDSNKVLVAIATAMKIIIYTMVEISTSKPYVYMFDFSLVMLPLSTNIFVICCAIFLYKQSLLLYFTVSVKQAGGIVKAVCLFVEKSGLIVAKGYLYYIRNDDIDLKSIILAIENDISFEFFNNLFHANNAKSVTRCNLFTY